MNFKAWFQESRGPFLLLPVVLIVLGGGVAHYEGHSNGLHLILAMIGLILMHIAVNVFNEVSDYRTKVDFHTNRTPFSGGSGMLTSGTLKVSSARNYAIACFSIATAIGVYFIYSTGWNLLPLLLAGGIIVLFYTPHLGKYTLGEFFAGIGLGALPILGTHYVISQDYTMAAFLASLAPFFLVFNLLLLNEFPDAEADKLGGRRHLVLRFGEKKAAWIYVAAESLSYVSIITGYLLGYFPVWTLLGLLTFPIGLQAMQGALKKRGNPELFVQAQGQNVLAVLVTILLTGVGFYLG